MCDENLPRPSDQPSTSAYSKDSQCSCIVCDLLTNGFSGRNLQQKTDIIAVGRHMPTLNLDTKIKACTRHFNVSFYEKHEWLTGCDTFTKLFCWPCLLFNTEKIVWNWGGFSDLNNFHRAGKRHVNSKRHLAAVVKEKTFGNYRIEQSLDNRLKLSHKEHNELVEKNRTILKRLIDVTCFLATHDQSFREHQEGNPSSSNRGNYMDLFELLSPYDPILKSHLNESSVFRGAANRIQNDLITSLSDVVLDHFKNEINNSPFISIILDDTTDLTNLSQLSVTLRYVKDDGTVQERFFCFLDINTDRSAEAMFKVVCDLVENLDCSAKLVAQSYDGAAVVAGHLKGLQAKVKEQYQNAIFVHCHRLNLVLSQSVGVIQDCKLFFATLRSFASFFSKSSKRTHALDIQVQKRFPEVAPTRWNYNGELVNIVFQYREVLIALFQDMLNDKDKWDAETVNSARGYLQLLEVDLNFNFLLNVFSEIFPHTDFLFEALQTEKNYIDFCVRSINTFAKILVEKREQFQHFWEKTNEFNTEPERKQIRVDHIADRETSYRRLFLEIFDNIVDHLRARFENISDLKFVELCSFSDYETSPFPEEALNSLKQNYGNLFDVAALRSQLLVLYEMPDLNKHKTSSDMLNFLKVTGLNKPYSEVVKLCQLVLTIPATSGSAEGSVSVFKRIKTFVKNSSGEEILSGLAVLCIEKDYVKYLLQKTSFYEAVINQFAKSDGRIALHYK